MCKTSGRGGGTSLVSATNSRGIERRFERSQNDLVLQASDFSLQGLKDMVDSEVIDMNPRYQRRERWDVARQSELIESFLLNVPVPPIYLAEEQYGIYSIIDGKQRVTAVSEYLRDGYKLSGLQAFPELNGASFSRLPKTLQSALKIRPYLRVITLLKQSKPELKFEVFIRLNRGGIQLNNQEIRNVAFRGPMNDCIYRCSENKLLKTTLKITGVKSPAYQQMQDAEYVLRFMTLYKDWLDFPGKLGHSMDKFMINNQNANVAKVKQFEGDFTTAIQRTHQLWGSLAFQRWDGSKWRQQALAGMFDAEMIAVSSLTEKEFAKVVTNKGRVSAETKKMFENKEFEEAVRLGTNIPSRLRLRVAKVRDALMNYS